MTTTFSERLRRALRGDLRNPPCRLVRYARGLGPIVEQDGVEMAVTVQGRLSSSVIGYLSSEDPMSRHLWSQVPREALRAEWMRPLGDEPQFACPVTATWRRVKRSRSHSSKASRTASTYVRPL